MTIEEIIHAMRKNKTCAFYDSDGYEDEINLLIEKDMDIIIDALEKQIPKKPCNDNENGVYEKEYCPNCHRNLFPNEHHCKCGQAIDWSDIE